MAIRIKLEPTMELNSEVLLRELKAEALETEPLQTRIEELIPGSYSLNPYQSWEDFTGRPTRSLVKTITWEEL